MVERTDVCYNRNHSYGEQIILQTLFYLTTIKADTMNDGNKNWSC